jgi:hypothetical protein
MFNPDYRYKPKKHTPVEPKTARSKFLNKPNFLKDTAGSKSKKHFGREKAHKIRTNSKNQKLITAKEKFDNSIYSAKNRTKPVVDKKDLDDITKLADEFWSKLETEKIQMGVKYTDGTSSKNSAYNSIEKPVSKQTPQTPRVHISQKTTFSQQMKNSQVRGSVDRFKNRHFYDKFRHSNNLNR